MVHSRFPLLRFGAALLGLSSLALADTAAERLDASSAMLTEIMGTSDKGIPQDLLDKASCVVLVPGVKKAAFIVGGNYGRGFMSCRTGRAGWSAPAALRVEGGSVGFQIGGSETDVVLLVLNQTGAEKLMSSKFTVGADAAVAAGPVGRASSAETDAAMRAEILSWSRSRGAFAGIALKGGTIRPDLDTNKELYGSEMTTKAIVSTSTAVPAAATSLIATLNKYSSRK